MKRPKTGGRQKGARNKVTRTIKEMAAEYGPEALEALVSIATTSTSDQARVAACKEILDRAYGKSPQALTGADGGAIKTEGVIRLELVRPNHASSDTGGL